MEKQLHLVLSYDLEILYKYSPNCFSLRNFKSKFVNVTNMLFLGKEYIYLYAFSKCVYICIHIRVVGFQFDWVCCDWETFQSHKQRKCVRIFR